MFTGVCSTAGCDEFKIGWKTLIKLTNCTEIHHCCFISVLFLLLFEQNFHFVN